MKKRVLIIGIIVVASGIFFSSGFLVGAATTKGAGSQNDPVVSLSYLDYRLSKLEGGSGNIGTSETKITVEKGKRFKPGEGSVIVVYQGACTALGKGLVNTTDACMVQEGMNVPLYSQILIPDDDSGIVAAEQVIIYIIR